MYVIRINRVRAKIITDKHTVGFDDTFDQGINIICSEKNTSGKSSIISMIYYGLGLEEIIGGKGFNVLSSAFKTKIESEGKELDVLESMVFLEVSNGSKDITILRSAKMESRTSNLVTIYHSKMDEIYESETKAEDMYVHLPYSATNKKGFFTFLESFIGMDLPRVPTTDDKERKLYLQLIFSSMLIEQKRGWADLFSGMPHFGIREPKKRVIEYLLNMDTLNNEKLRQKLRLDKKNIVEKWKQLYNETVLDLNKLGLILKGITANVEIINDSNQIGIIYEDNDNAYSLEEYIKIKKSEYQKLVKFKRKNIDNFEELKTELIQIENDIIEYEEKINRLKINLKNEKSGLDRLLNSLKLIQTDIINNQDAKKLRNLGSKERFNSFENICPTCNQSISDTLLVSQNVSEVMSIDDNIRHLKSQEELFEFAIKQKNNNLINIKNNIHLLESKVSKLYQLLRITKNDIFAIDGSVSERTIYKKVELGKTINELEKVKAELEGTIDIFIELSNEWKEYLAEYGKLPDDKFTSLDERKIKTLRNNFVSNLKLFGYRSISDINKVNISRDTYMPIIENFDLKFDSSASDHIRGIWAFTLALTQTSNELNGNHPGILIFDEPGQHSIVVEDMEAFIDCLIDLSTKNQVILGITIKETDTRELIFRKIDTGCKGIFIQDRAFNNLD